MVQVIDGVKDKGAKQGEPRHVRAKSRASDAVHPKRIRLEASTFCQLKCPTCETASGELYKTVPLGYLRFDNFKMLVDENPCVEEIELSNFGEIFLNPQLPKMMAYAFEKGVYLSASNGANLNTVRDSVLEDLVRYRFRHIRCSLDGATPETYAIYRIKGNLDQVLANIRRINELKARYDSPYPMLTWQFVVFGHNEHELPLAKRMAQDLGMDFIAKLNWDDSYSPVRDKDAVARHMAEGVTSRREYKAKYGIHYMDKVCHQLWDEPQINFDGTVWGCCRNNWQPFKGNAFRDGLDQALNGDDISYARAMLEGKVAAREDIPCTSCRLYKDMQREGRVIERPGKNKDRP